MSCWVLMTTYCPRNILISSMSSWGVLRPWRLVASANYESLLGGRRTKWTLLLSCKVWLDKAWHARIRYGYALECNRCHKKRRVKGCYNYCYWSGVHCQVENRDTRVVRATMPPSHTLAASTVFPPFHQNDDPSQTESNISMYCSVKSLP